MVVVSKDGSEVVKVMNEQFELEGVTKYSYLGKLLHGVLS